MVMQYGFEYGIEIWGMFVAQLCLVLILLIFGNMPCLKNCLVIDRNQDANTKQKFLVRQELL